MRWSDVRVSAVGEPQLVRLLDGAEEARTDWRTECGGVLNIRTGEIELPTPTFAPCPYENCSECAKGAG